MHLWRGRPPLFIAAAVPAVLLALFLLFVATASTVSPDASAAALAENVIVGVTLLLTAGLLIYGLFRPYLGGLLLFGCAVLVGLVLNGFHLSEVLLPSRTVGYSPFWSVVTGVVLLVGGLFVLSGRAAEMRRT